jgi:hypothetical protein
VKACSIMKMTDLDLDSFPLIASSYTILIYKVYVWTQWESSNRNGFEPNVKFRMIPKLNKYALVIAFVHIPE